MYNRLIIILFKYRYNKGNEFSPIHKERKTILYRLSADSCKCVSVAKQAMQLVAVPSATAFSYALQSVKALSALESRRVFKHCQIENLEYLSAS